MVNQDGLEWVGKTFGLEPRWTTDPRVAAIEFLARKYLKIEHESPCRVTFHAQGAFNKLYRIESCNNSRVLMRVTLPVDPQNKTRSEVATIDFLRQNTDIPVAKIYAYDASSDNVLGFEWILMEMLPGNPLRSRWRKLSMEAKRALVEVVVRHQAQLFHHKFSGIGSIFDNTASSTPKILSGIKPMKYVLGQMVSMIFFWGDHINQDFPRGPFSSSYDWLDAQLRLVINDQNSILNISEDEDDIEDAEEAKAIAHQLLQLLPKIFPISTPSPEPTVLFHDDLSWQNILIDDNGTLTGIIDWECVSALPLWRSCQLPTFLQGRERNDEPVREQYAADEDTEDDDLRSETALDNEGVNSLYWVHLLEYETAVLRRLFLDRMMEIEPAWAEESKKGALKADFNVAVQNCDNSFCLKKIRKWLKDLEDGMETSLRGRLVE